MIPADKTFGGTWPFKPRFSLISGFKQHFIDEGSRNSNVLVCLHGEPTWGYLYRFMIPSLSRDYRVIVPDHMGFGKSETPLDREYTLKSHVDNLIAFTEELELNDITFIAQDWGGPIAGAFSLQYPDKVKRLILMNTFLGYSGHVANKEKSRWFNWIEEHDEKKTLCGILGELGSTVVSVMKILGFENSCNIDANWIEAYSSPFPDRKSCIGAIQFPLDIHHRHCISYIVDCLKLGNLDKLKQKPAMLAEGLKDNAIHPENTIEDFKALWPAAPIKTFENAGHFCQEDVPDLLVEAIQEFLHDNK